MLNHSGITKITNDKNKRNLSGLGPDCRKRDHTGMAKIVRKSSSDWEKDNTKELDLEEFGEIPYGNNHRKDETVPEEGLFIPVRRDPAPKKTYLSNEGSQSIQKEKICKKNKVMKLPPSYELSQKFSAINRVIVYGGILRVYQSGAYIPLDESSYHAMVEKMLTAEKICMNRRPTIKEIRDSYAHLYAELNGEEDTIFQKVKKDENKIVFTNCIYDAATHAVFKHSPNFFTLMPIKAKYIEREVETPVFDYFIESLDVSGEFSTMKTLFLEMLGYISIANPSGKCFFYLAPARDSGKSLFANFIQSIFPDDMVSTESINDLNQRFALADIEKKAICISMDLTSNTLSRDAVARIKNMTGDRKITVDQKYIPRRTVAHNCKFIFGSNHGLKISAPDPAFWERVVVIPFVNTIPRERQDMNLLQQLLKEKDAIMTLAARSLSDLLENNFVFPQTNVAKRLYHEWMGDAANSVLEFVRYCCELMEGVYSFTADLYDKYVEFCEEFCFIPIADTEFAKTISRFYFLKRGKRRKDGKALNGFFGIKIKDESI